MNIRNNINYGETTLGLDIKKVEVKYGAQYIGDFCLKDVNGNWSDRPAAVFYQPNPNKALGHTNYFGLIIQNGSLYITKGDSAFEEPIGAYLASNGEIIYSRFGHDFRTSSDGSVTVDGGRWYGRVLWAGGEPPKSVRLVIEGPDLKVQESQQS